MRSCINKADGRILEAQSNDEASMDALISNAAIRGNNSSEIEFVILPDAEVHSRVNAYNEALQPEAEPTLKELLAALEKKHVITKGEVLAERKGG